MIPLDRLAAFGAAYARAHDYRDYSTMLRDPACVLAVATLRLSEKGQPQPPELESFVLAQGMLQGCAAEDRDLLTRVMENAAVRFAHQLFDAAPKAAQEPKASPAPAPAAPTHDEECPL